jgi:hypothetical protein
MVDFGKRVVEFFEKGADSMFYMLENVLHKLIITKQSQTPLMLINKLFRLGFLKLNQRMFFNTEAVGCNKCK